MGAYAAEVANTFLMEQDWWVAKLAGVLGQLTLPLLKDLERGSPLIEKLVDDTRKAAVGASFTNHIVAERVLWAEHEYVVWSEGFLDDPDSDLIYGKNHFSVCKPDAFGHEAAKAILEVL